MCEVVWCVAEATADSPRCPVHRKHPDFKRELSLEFDAATTKQIEDALTQRRAEKGCQ